MHPNEPSESGGTKTLIERREGFKPTSYVDTEGNLTGGTGHKLTDAEKLRYPKGTNIPKEVTDNWKKQDTQKSKQSAKSQIQELRLDNTQFERVLESVNFQLGTSWNKDHNKTWDALLEEDYDTAIEEVKSSLWMKQTPKRANDFIKAIQKLK